MVCEQATKGREEGGGGGGSRKAYSAFSLPFFYNPAFRASVIFIMNTVFLPKPHPEILANPVSRPDILRLLDSRTTQIPRIPLQTLYVAEEVPVRRPKGT